VSFMFKREWLINFKSTSHVKDNEDE
jgi:hypothetical protein